MPQLVPDRLHRHVERPLSDAPPAEYMQLAHATSDGRLGLYVGAGISVPTPTLLPTSGELLERLAPLVERELGIGLRAVAPDDEGADPDAQASLECLADQAEEVGVLAPLRELAASVVPFRDALPTFGHRVIAALLREGSVTVFSVNWDRCIEKGAAQLGFPVVPTITEADRAVRYASCQFHKVHGCATQPPSLLITTNDLRSPPRWVEHVVGAALGAGAVVFVGLGTVGGYVRKRVVQLLDVLVDADVWLADPYPSRTWTELLERAENHILEVDANNFFDDLLRAFVRHGLAQLSDAARDMDAPGREHPVAPVVERLVQAIDARQALEVISWLRAGAGGVADGSPFVNSRDCRTALLALAVIAHAAPFRLRGEQERLVLEAGTAAIELAVWPETRPDEMVERETARVGERDARHCYSGFSPEIYHLCVGHRGPLPRPEAPSDIGGGNPRAGDLLESEPMHYWVPAEAVLQGTFEIEIAA